MNRDNDRIKGTLIRLCNSPYYIAAVAALAFLFFVTGLSFIGIVISSAIFAVTLLFTDNERYCFPPLLTMIFQLSFVGHDADNELQYFSSPAAITFFAVAAAIMAIALIVYFVKIYKTRQRKTDFFRRPMFWAFVALFAATIFGGLFYKPYDFSSLLYAVGIGGMFLAFYAAFAFLCDKTEQTRIYLARTMVSVMLLIAAELAVFYAFNFADYGIMSSDWKAVMHIGWGISNTIGAMLVMLIPAAYYLINKNIDAPFHYFTVFVAITATYFTMSRTALVVGAPMCVILTIISFVKNKSLRPLLGVMSACFVLAYVIFAIAIILTGKIDVFTDFFIKNSVSGSGTVEEASRGRTDLWKGYFELFKSSPVFGAGFYNAFEKLRLGGMTRFSGMAHNTIMQYLGSCGIVGIAGYLYHRYRSVRLFVKGYSYEKLMFAAGCASVVCMSLLDVFFLSPYFAMFYCLYIVLSENVQKGETEINE